jgi:hypothetical protein
MLYFLHFNLHNTRPVQGSDDPEPEPDHLNAFEGVRSNVHEIV